MFRGTCDCAFCFAWAKYLRIDRALGLVERAMEQTLASGKTKLHVHELVARRFPRPNVASTIRKLPTRRTQAVEPSVASMCATLPGAPPPDSQAPCRVSKDLPPAIEAAVAPRAKPAHSARSAVVEPLSAARYRIQLNASAQLKQKLDQAVELLSHSIPTGDLSVVITRSACEQTQPTSVATDAHAPAKTNEHPVPARTARHSRFLDETNR